MDGASATSGVAARAKGMGTVAGLVRLKGKQRVCNRSRVTVSSKRKMGAYWLVGLGSSRST